MKKYAYTYIFALLAILALQSCASVPVVTPETLNERLATIEIGYQGVLKTATRWRAEGRLSDDRIRKFNDLFDDYERQRSLVRAAISLGDIAKAQSDMTELSGSLTTIRNLITEIENE